MKLVRLALMNKNKEQGSFCQPADDLSWADLIKDAELTSESGDYYIIKLIEMAEDQYKKLGEFTGF